MTTRATISMTEVEDYIRRSVHSPNWLRDIQLKLDLIEDDPGERRDLEDQLRRRREALIEFGEVRPTPLNPGDER